MQGPGLMLRQGHPNAGKGDPGDINVAYTSQIIFSMYRKDKCKNANVK